MKIFPTKKKKKENHWIINSFVLQWKIPSAECICVDLKSQRGRKIVPLISPNISTVKSDKLPLICQDLSKRSQGVMLILTLTIFALGSPVWIPLKTISFWIFPAAFFSLSAPTSRNYSIDCLSESAKQRCSIWTSDSTGDKELEKEFCWTWWLVFRREGLYSLCFYLFLESRSVCFVLSASELQIPLSDCNHHCLHFVPLQVCNLVWATDADRCGERG